MNEHFKRAGPAVEAHYQFLLWLVPTVDRFPKSQKFVFGTASSTSLLAHSRIGPMSAAGGS
jgi:hypothetical protein